MKKELKPVAFKLDIYKGKILPNSKKGSKSFTVTASSEQTKIKAIKSYYDVLKDKDVTVNGTLKTEGVFNSLDDYHMIVVMFCNMIIEHKINPLNYYEGIVPEVIIELEKLRVAGYDLRDHFRGPEYSRIDVLADAPGIIQNAHGGEMVH